MFINIMKGCGLARTNSDAVLAINFMHSISTCIVFRLTALSGQTRVYINNLIIKLIYSNKTVRLVAMML